MLSTKARGACDVAGGAEGAVAKDIAGDNDFGESQRAGDAGSRGVTCPMVTELCEEIESF